MGALLQRGTLHYWRSEYAEAEARLREALALSTELGDGFIAIAALFFSGNAQVNLGRIGDGRRSFHEAMALARPNGDSYWLARLLGQMGWLHRELEDFDKAKELDRQSVAVTREAGTRWAPEPDALLSQFLDEAHSGTPSKDAEQARRDSEQQSAERALVGWFFEIRRESGLAAYAAGRGDAAAVLEHATRLLHLASDKGAPTYGVTAHKLLAEAALLQGRLDDALASLDTALDVLRVHPCPLIAWRTLATLGRVQERRGARAEARAAFTEAASIVHRIAGSDDDPTLPQVFLKSPAVQEVLAGASLPLAN
jgi:tetratricopeptide (TPR) repeat protein